MESIFSRFTLKKPYSSRPNTTGLRMTYTRFTRLGDADEVWRAFRALRRTSGIIEGLFGSVKSVT